jgi:transposase
MATKETSRHQDAFEAWYESGRSFRTVSENLGIKRSTFYDWADRFDWHERADKRDAEAARIADEEAAKERAERQKRRRQSGELLAIRGREFFKTYSIDNARDAIQAIKIGTEIERKEDGVPDWVLLILNADTDDLEKMASILGGPVTAGGAAGESDDSLALESESEED